MTNIDLVEEDDFLSINTFEAEDIDRMYEIVPATKVLICSACKTARASDNGKRCPLTPGGLHNWSLVEVDSEGTDEGNSYSYSVQGG